MAKLQNRSMPQLADWVHQNLVRALIRGTGQDVAKVFAKIDTNNTGALSRRACTTPALCSRTSPNTHCKHDKG